MYCNIFCIYFGKQVLLNKTGIPITLSIVYISVARRLGIELHPVNFPSHFLIKWKEHPM
jgi:F-box protein 21